MKKTICASAALILGVLALGACSSGPASPNDLLDENTGSTLSVVAQPLMFARVRSDGGASARDWVTLVAVERDNQGKYADFLLAYRWSTFDAGLPAPAQESPGLLTIQSDARAIQLQPLEQLPLQVSQHHKELFVPEGANLTVHAYAIDFDTLRAIAAGRQLSVRLTQDTDEMPLVLWLDGRAALTQFVQRATGS